MANIANELKKISVRGILLNDIGHLAETQISCYRFFEDGWIGLNDVGIAGQERVTNLISEELLGFGVFIWENLESIYSPSVLALDFEDWKFGLSNLIQNFEVVKRWGIFVMKKHVRKGYGSIQFKSWLIFSSLGTLWLAACVAGHWKGRLFGEGEKIEGEKYWLWQKREWD